MLNELFSWTILSEERIPILPHRMTKFDFDNDYKRAVVKQREFKYARKPEESSGILSSNFSDHIAYMGFLEFCKNEIKYSEYFSPYLMLIKYFIRHIGSREFKVIDPVILSKLFDESVAHNRKESLDFYRDFSPALESIRPINTRAKLGNILDNFERIDKLLTAQKDPLSMVPMFRILIEDLEPFAAAILWLLRRGVVPARILQTNLLQSFMSYHLVALHAEENPISRLYELLSQFPEAHELVALAAKVECEERGFYCEQEGGQSYTLTGVMCAHSSLNRVALVEHAIDYTPTMENIDALYQLFGANFLFLKLAYIGF